LNVLQNAMSEYADYSLYAVYIVYVHNFPAHSMYTLLKKQWENAPLSVDFMWAWKKSPRIHEGNSVLRVISIHRLETELVLQQCV
jgi:hypothetical protein